MVVLVSAGVRPTSGYAIEIDSVVSLTDELVVWLTMVYPGRTCGRYQVSTTPVDAVQVPRRTMYVRFAERSVMRECR